MSCQNLYNDHWRSRFLVLLYTTYHGLVSWQISDYKKNKTIKNAKTDCKKTENKFKKKKENIYISNELMHIIALILILEI